MAKTKKLPAFLKPPFLNNIPIVFSQRKISISPQSVRKVVVFLAQYYRISIHELTIHFVGKKKITALHAQFFQDPTPTDCITFPYEGAQPGLIGEIFICPEIAYEYISKKGKDLYKEITLYVIHGFLHLIGFSDSETKEKKKMRYQENMMLELLNKNHLAVSPNKS